MAETTNVKELVLNVLTEDQYKGATIQDNELYLIKNMDNSEVFIATYGSTTFDDIVEAYNANKICICKRNDHIPPLCYYLTIISSDTLRFNLLYENIIYNIYCTKDSSTGTETWSESTFTCQNKNYLTQEINVANSTEGTEYYPSTKAVKDYAVPTSSIKVIEELNIPQSGWLENTDSTAAYYGLGKYYQIIDVSEYGLGITSTQYKHKVSWSPATLFNIKEILNSGMQLLYFGTDELFFVCDKPFPDNTITVMVEDLQVMRGETI